ncbi:hypothetical protein PRNP1_006672 [Phytophthora ramorum]
MGLPLSQVLLLGNWCRPAWPHYTLPHPNGKHLSQGESSDEEGPASFRILRPSEHAPRTHQAQRARDRDAHIRDGEDRRSQSA